MLIPNQYTDVKINKKNIEYFIELGYECESGVIITIPIEHLTKGSHKYIDVKCDYCNEVIKKEYRDYIKSKKSGLDCCKKCHATKVNEVVNNKYGVNNVFQLEEVKEKIKVTNLIKYGVEHHSQSEEGKIKKINTCLAKYGVDNPAKLAEFKNKAKQTNLLKYGFEYVLSSPLIREQIIKTNIKKYGVENYTQTKEYRIRATKTNLLKYGYKFASQSPKVIKKRNNTLFKNGSVRTSSQQIELHNIIQKRYPEAILNYPCSRCIFDIALLLDNDIKIDIEYDGWFWHKNQQSDRRRDEYFKSNSWKILRIKSGHKLPTNDELFEAINKLVNNNHNYKEIILDDWKIDKIS